MRGDTIKNLTPILLFISRIICYSSGNAENGNWGEWKERGGCNLCHGVRYKYNCTIEDGTAVRKQSNKICNQGIYHQKLYKVLNGCFIRYPEEESSTPDDYYEDYGSFNIEGTDAIEDTLRLKGLWDAGMNSWSACGRGNWRRKHRYNRRGLQRRIFECPTDLTTVWREEWRYCCAGYWTQWKTIEGCPECGPGRKRSVRICAPPRVQLSQYVERLSKMDEYLSQWRVQECGVRHCKVVEEKVKYCREVCAEGNWWEGTECQENGKQELAGDCCARGYTGIRSTCGEKTDTDESESQQQRTTTMVAIVLGAEALVIAVTAIIVVLYNLGRVPSVLSGLCGSCCSCASPARSHTYRPSSGNNRKSNNNTRAAQRKARKKIKVKNAQELKRFLESSSREEETTVVV